MAGTEQLLAALKSTGLKATFFVVGSRVTANPQLVKAIVDQGHEIGVHSYTHNPLTSLSNEQVVAEIKYTEAAIFKAAGITPVLFRPPYGIFSFLKKGDMDDRIRGIATALGYRSIMWTSNPQRDTNDASNSLNATLNTTAGQTAIVGTVSTWFNVATGFISLEHDLNPFCVNVAVQILKNIQSAGQAVSSRIKTVGECSNIPLPKPVVNGTNTSTPTRKTGGSTSIMVTGTFIAIVLAFLAL